MTGTTKAPIENAGEYFDRVRARNPDVQDGLIRSLTYFISSESD